MIALVSCLGVGLVLALIAVVHLTVTLPQRMVRLTLDQWAATAMFANWIEGRAKGDRETWLVTCYDEHSGGFLQAARNVGVTVEEIEGGGDDESYVLVVGEPGSGWQS